MIPPAAPWSLSGKAAQNGHPGIWLRSCSCCRVRLVLEASPEVCQQMGRDVCEIGTEELKQGQEGRETSGYSQHSAGQLGGHRATRRVTHTGSTSTSWRPSGSGTWAGAGHLFQPTEGALVPWKHQKSCTSYRPASRLCLPLLLGPGQDPPQMPIHSRSSGLAWNWGKGGHCSSCKPTTPPAPSSQLSPSCLLMKKERKKKSQFTPSPFETQHVSDR